MDRFLELERASSMVAACLRRTGRVLRGLLLTVSLAPCLAAGAGFELVTPAELAEAMTAPVTVDELMPKSVPDGPSITVVSPQVDQGAIASPVDIEVTFEPVGGATIDMTSLRIYYLMLIRKDVTDRILEHAEIGADTLRAPGARLPAGKHRFLLEISDSERRKSSRKFSVLVES